AEAIQFTLAMASAAFGVVRDSGPAMYRKQRSKPYLAEVPKILAELLYSVMDRDLAFRQEGLKRELSHFRQAARLRERKPLRSCEKSVSASSCLSSGSLM